MSVSQVTYDVLIVGAGADGIAAAASLKSRKQGLEIAIIDPADVHYYQSGWTLVGAGVFTPKQPARTLASLILKGVKWIKARVEAFDPQADAWARRGVQKNIDIKFNNAGGVLFGVKGYVSALIEYVKKYDATLNFFHTLVAVDGPAKKAWFDVAKPDSPFERIEPEFDILHVCTPESAPDFVKESPLADAAGWVDLDQTTLRQKTYPNIWSLGDVMNAPNARTAAASARKQAPVVADNIVRDMRGSAPRAQYDGYGSCPLTVERGKVEMVEFGYGGAMLPSLPKALLGGTKPSSAAPTLKERFLPPLYRGGMPKGREWLAKPESLTSSY